MKGDKNIVTLLNDVLTAELTAVNQYFLHARLCHHWGYEKLYERVRKESIEEMKPRRADRPHPLPGRPPQPAALRQGQRRPDRPGAVQARPGRRVRGRQALHDGIEACRAAGDNGTREILERMLREEESHVDWLETQQETIKQLGVERYLSEQLK